METTFEKAKIGDKLWDFVWGWGTVTCIDTEINYCIHVTFPGSQLKYNYKGESNLCWNRTLFWDEVKIEPPPRPKRMVKKTGWAYSYHIHPDPTAWFPKEHLVKVEYEAEE